jgi:Extensin-like protein C-terminus
VNAARGLGLICSAIALAGCAHEPPEAQFPRTAGGGWITPRVYGWNSASAPVKPAILAAPDPARAKSVYDRIPKPRASAELRSVLPGSEDCLTRLSWSGTQYRLLDHALGVKTPVVVDAPIAGVRYHTISKSPLIADCRLVLALVSIGPELNALGITDMRFSGAWVYRLSRAGRLSLHAYGLAIDVHGFSMAGRNYDIRHDFSKGLGSNTCLDGPPANAFACRMRRTGLFHELLTPDDNADHYDHIHLGVSPLPEEAP